MRDRSWPIFDRRWPAIRSDRADENPAVAIIGSLAAYGVGYIARPIGAVVVLVIGAIPMAVEACWCFV